MKKETLTKILLNFLEILHDFETKTVLYINCNEDKNYYEHHTC